MGMEYVAACQGYSRYKINRYQINLPYGETRTEFGGHDIVIERFNEEAPTGNRGSTYYAISIDGKSFGRPRPQHAQFERRDREPLALVEISDVASGNSTLYIAEAIPDPHDTDSYRIVSVHSDGRIDEESFAFSDRSYPPYRVLVIQYVSEKPIGFYSNVMTTWPSLLYPIIYPIVTAVSGLIFIGVSIIRRK